MNYVTYFEASRFPTNDLFGLGVGALLMCITGLIAYRPDILEKLGGGFSKVGAWPKFFRSVPFGIVVCWIVAVSFSFFARARHLADLLSRNDCQIVEGQVANFHPMPYSGHDTERFTVNGAAFSYSDYITSGGFNQTSSHGGPIHESLPVRICHTDGEILRLEIAR